jgi:hypothetical protein
MFDSVPWCANSEVQPSPQNHIDGCPIFVSTAGLRYELPVTIVFHLTAERGKIEPLFSSALLVLLTAHLLEPDCEVTHRVMNWVLWRFLLGCRRKAVKANLLLTHFDKVKWTHPSSEKKKNRRFSTVMFHHTHQFSNGGAKCTIFGSLVSRSLRCSALS